MGHNFIKCIKIIPYRYENEYFTYTVNVTYI